MAYFQGELKVKGKYTGTWENRKISIDPYANLMTIMGPQPSLYKHFCMNSLEMKNAEKGELLIATGNGRKYQVKGKGCQDLIEAVQANRVYERIGKDSESLQVQQPKNIKYKEINSISVSTADDNKPKQSLKQQEKEKKYPRQKSYLLQKDWVINEHDGGMILFNQEKKKNQGKILKFVLKKFLSTGSFMGISFPVFAMKPQSILETYCKSISTAPLIFKNDSDAVQRIKQFITFTFAFSRIFTDMEKPFNPVIGETFQAEIAGGKFSAEQTSHHPPQSSIFFEGKDYKIYGTLELFADIGINSALGLFLGDVIVQYENGQRVIGRFLSGEMSGFIVGENKFRPQGSCYVYDQKSKINSTYKRVRKDIFEGSIGVLKTKAQHQFEKKLKEKSRFTEFEAFQKKQYVKVYSSFQLCWSKYLKFDNIETFNFNDQYWLPFEPTLPKTALLQSDSRHRNDIKYRYEKKYDESQKQKQKIEENERDLRKLREKHNKK